MAEIDREDDELDPVTLRRAVRHRLRRDDPGLRVVVEGFLAATSEIDLLAVGAEGELVSVRIAAPGEDATALTRLLSDLAWLRPRLEDLLRIAPGLGLEPSAEPRGLLVAPDFGWETRLAVENLPHRTIGLLTCRTLGRQAGQPMVLLEPCPSLGPAPTASGRRAASPETAIAPDRSRAPVRPVPEATRPSRPRRPLADPPSASTFRTGLTEADLRDLRPSRPRSREREPGAPA